MTVAPLIAMKSSSFATRWAMKSSGSQRDWSLFGREREQLRETLRSFDPSLPRFGAGKMRDALSAAQSSIQSLLSAMDSRAASEQELRESEERLDGLRWQLRTSPESSRREVRG
jgi:hypothetical protein